MTEINGRPTAQLMFFNGLSKLKENGELMPIPFLPNPYLADNLALSFNMQLAANTAYPGFTRKVYLEAYRYSLAMLPKSMLIKVGAQTKYQGGGAQRYGTAGRSAGLSAAEVSPSSKPAGV